MQSYVDISHMEMFFYKSHILHFVDNLFVVIKTARLSKTYATLITFEILLISMDIWDVSFKMCFFPKRLITFITFEILLISMDSWNVTFKMCFLSKRLITFITFEILHIHMNSFYMPFESWFMTKTFLTIVTIISNSLMNTFNMKLKALSGFGTVITIRIFAFEFVVGIWSSSFWFWLDIFFSNVDLFRFGFLNFWICKNEIKDFIIYLTLTITYLGK